MNDPYRTPSVPLPSVLELDEPSLVCELTAEERIFWERAIIAMGSDPDNGADRCINRARKFLLERRRLCGR